MNVAKLPSQIFIGYEADNAWTPVVIDWTEWAEKEPGGVLTVLLQRNGDANPYPVVLTTDGTVSTWRPSSTDTAVPGFGRLQLKYTVGDVVGHSKVLNVNIGRSLEPATDPPDPYESWLDTLTELAAETEQYANSAQQSAEDAEDAQTAAEAAEQSAEGYAASAQESATAASTSAQAAAASETNAALFESNAQGYANRAETAQTRAESAQSGAESARDTAVASATSAGQSAESAGASASSAESSASSAASSATSAGQYATNAESSATSASGSASSASESASSATQSATQAGQSASSASQSATQASGSASSASASATAASASATSASESATSASASATSAEASAESAAQSASEALATLLDTAPVITDTASGAIASFSDGASDRPVVGLSVGVEPVQDLHGQSAPYPAGGGKNKLDPSKRTSYGNGNGQRWYESDGFTLKANQAYTLSVTYVNPIALYIRDKATGDYLATGNVSITYTPTEDVVVYFQAYRGEDISSVNTFQLELGSTATAYAPYSNICPITGHTQTTVTRTGRNLLNLVESEMVSSGWNRHFPIQLNAGTYIISCQNQFGYESNKGARVDLIDESLNSLINLVSAYNFGSDLFVGSAVAISADIAQKAKYIRFNLRGGGVTYAQIAVGNIQLETGSTAHAYEPYTAQTITIPFGSTVYGGTVDVVSGVLTVDRAMVDLGTLTWRYNQANLSGFDTSDIASVVAGGNNAVCSVYPNLGAPMTTGNVTANDGFYRINKSVGGSAETGNFGVGALLIKDTRYTGVASFVAGVSGQYLCYEIAQPVEIPLTPQQLTTLYGDNNVWSDTGDTAVEYRADTKKYIQKMIASAL